METSEPSHVRLPFNPSYKLASGYMQEISVLERVPKIDGYTMPPPRQGGSNAVADLELNAMFKSVMHRPTPPLRSSDASPVDPLLFYAPLHAKPTDPDPDWPWSPITAFSGAWNSYLQTVQDHARRASRKLLARQELETLWETKEMDDILSSLAGLPQRETSSASAGALDLNRLTCVEYVSYITVEVVRNMDAIAWARVNRKTRLP